MSRWLRRQVCVWALTACLPLLAQEFRAGISGIVKDSQGALMPGVPIEAQNVATNEISRTTTNATGYYVFPVLPIGTYRVTAAPAGFKKEVREGLELRVGDQVQQDFKLEIGAVTETVSVTSETELLQTVATDKGQVVSLENVRDMPSVGRNPFLLGIEATGVQFDVGGILSRAARPFDAGNNVAESMSINGGRTGASDLLLDGVPDTSTEGSSAANMAFVPNQDAVSEFRIVTDNYDAQYGRTAGGTLTVSLKNGTNSYHGAAYWYVKNTILTANSFDQNRAGKDRAAYHQNEPGLELDGPVIIPHVYNGRNRTFFMYSVEFWRDSIPSPTTTSTAQVAAIHGDFNTTLFSNNGVIKPITIYDPLTSSVSTTPRQAFPGDIIPQTRMNPLGVKLASYIPAPNNGDQTVFANQSNNLVIAPNPRTDAYDAHIARVDQTINDKERFFSRFVRGYRTEVNSTNGFPIEASPQYSDGRLSQGGNFDLTSILSPTTVLTSRVGYLRHDLWITLYASGFDPSTLGFPSSLLKTLPAYFPAISGVYTAFGAGRSGGNQFTDSSVWSWGEIANKTIGRHQMKFGGEFRSNLDNINSPTTNFGSFSFSSGWTQLNALTSTTGTGNGLAGLLLGMPSGGSAPINPAYAYGYHYYGAFVQDDWRVTNKLTLSLGLRWDYESPVTERNNQQIASFDFSASSPVQVVNPLQPGATLKGGLTYPTSGNRMSYQRDLNNIQPRLGLAWHPEAKTVVRAGYGVSYLATYTTTPGTGFSASTPYVASNDGNVTFAGNYLNNPYPQGILTPLGSAQGLSTNLGQSVSFVNPNRVVPKVHEFSLGVQRELPFRTVLEVSYAGSRSKELDVSHQLDSVTMAQLLQYGGPVITGVPNLSDTCSATSAACPYANPFQNKVPTATSLGSAASTTRLQLLRPYPQFTGVQENNLPIGQLWYNSMQVRVEKRLSRGLNFVVSYTLSKQLDGTGYLNDQDAGPSRTLGGQDTPHRLVVSGNWALPIFEHSHGITSVLLKGWQLNGIFQVESGFPLGAPSGFYSTGINPNIADPTDLRSFNTCTLLVPTTAAPGGTRTNCASADEPLAFIQQQPNTLRTLSSRFPTLRPPKVPDADLSMFKGFSLHERLQMQFRAEAFNATNSPQLGSPNTGLTGSTAGQIGLTQANDPRNIQLSLRLMF